MMVNIYDADSMRELFITADVKGTSSIPYHSSLVCYLLLHTVVLMTDSLWLMYVSKGKIVKSFAHAISRQGFYLSDFKTVVGWVHSCYSEMSHHDDRFIVSIHIRNFVKE